MNLDAVKDFKVLLVGDAIIDEYQYVTTIGKSIKEPVISTRFESKEVFLGGVWAAATHLKDLCAKVDVMTGKRVMVNTRFVDKTYKRKLFTLHADQPIRDAYEPSLPIHKYDLVIVLDFGHGAMTPELIDQLTDEARFLCVNAQTNSQNYGFNVITQYPRADFIVLDELEARLATRMRYGSVDDVIRKLGHKKIIVTQGANGVLGYDGEFHAEPAQAHDILDTMGAGDAVLAVSSPFAAAGFPMSDLVRIGNAAGAVKCQILGHQQRVTKKALEAQLGSKEEMTA